MSLLATDRYELGIRRYPLVVYTLVPLAALVLQAWLPRQRGCEFVAYIDLPFVITVYFALGRRSPLQGTMLGCLLGLMQDALTHQPIGLYGITKSIVGFIAGSVGVRIDETSRTVRLIVVILLSLASSAIYLFIFHELLGLNLKWNWITELLRALGNSLVALTLFPLLDRTEMRD